jgi:hypothetical protein
MLCRPTETADMGTTDSAGRLGCMLFLVKQTPLMPGLGFCGHSSGPGRDWEYLKVAIIANLLQGSCTEMLGFGNWH